MDRSGLDTITVPTVTSPRPLRPGLAKVRTPPILLRRRPELVATLSARVLELFEAASVISEGDARNDDGALTYYGTTSLLFPRASAGGLVPDADDAALAFALRNDPHARLQIVRVAHREASSRAGAEIGPVRAELSVAIGPRGVMVSVDVMARILRARTASGST